jgi:hypothetical protein
VLVSGIDLLGAGQHRQARHFDVLTREVLAASDNLPALHTAWLQQCGGNPALAFNPFEPGLCFPHGAHFLHVPPWRGETPRGFVTDFTGVRTPWEWDCNETASRNYRSYAPSRGIDCRRFEGVAGALITPATYPTVDEEYFEWEDVVSAAVEATDRFVAVGPSTASCTNCRSPL